MASSGRYRLARRSALHLADGIATSDVVVLGSGVAGLSAALSLTSPSRHRAPSRLLRPRRVTVITKGALESGSSPWAQGGIAAAIGPGDDPANHAADTVGAGVGLADPSLVAGLIEEAPEHIARLLDRGVRFDRLADGRLSLGREGAHSHHRILHAGGDATGAEMVRALIDSLIAEQAARGSIETVVDTFAEDLVVEDGRVVGVLTRRADGKRLMHRAGAVVLATGGCGQLWSKTTNPAEVTGDGLAMAARAGAILADLEMIQFHPTALDVADLGAAGLEAGGASLPLLTEALRGEGAILVDGAGRRFMPSIDRRAELAPRDVVARAIYRRLARGEQVDLDAREAVGTAFPERFPTVWRACQRFGIDPRHAPMPVTPAAHYAMAGVAVDARGRTSLDGLWACGEVTSSGLHGANRLASNSLLEGVIYGARVAEDIAGASPPPRIAARPGSVRVPRDSGRPRSSGRPGTGADADTGAATVRATLRHRAWRDLGLERDRAGLERLLDWLADRRIDDDGARVERGETLNLLNVASMVAAASLAREESRGAHYRTDHPRADPTMERRMMWTFEPDGDASPLRPAGSEPLFRQASSRQEIA